LSSVEANLKPGRKIRTGFLAEDIEAYQRVERLRKQLVGYDAATTDEILVMIATSDTGPYVIIDGTHRVTALYLNDLRAPNMPWKGLLITDPAIANSAWNINSPAVQSVMNTWKSWAAMGALI
jgi:hypothetical protein